MTFLTMQFGYYFRYIPAVMILFKFAWRSIVDVKLTRNVEDVRLSLIRKVGGTELRINTVKILCFQSIRKYVKSFGSMEIASLYFKLSRQSIGGNMFAKIGISAGKTLMIWTFNQLFIP